MVASKLFKSVNDGGYVDGSVTRFLSDFIIPSEQHVRVYSFVYDAVTKPLPATEDNVSVDLFDLVDNSIVFYEAPASTQTIVIEVATTPEEFGDVVAQGAVVLANIAKDAAQASAVASADSASSSATSAGESATSAVNANQSYLDVVASIDTLVEPTTIVRKDSDTGVAFLPAGTTAERPTLTVNDRAIRYNTDLLTFEGWNGTTWTGVGGGATGGGSDKVFVLNEQTVTADYTIPVGQNAHSAGTITIATGVTVTIPDGSQWVIS